MRFVGKDSHYGQTHFAVSPRHIRFAAPFAMLRRKQEINQQLQQVLDAFLLVLAFWSGYALRFLGTRWFDWTRCRPSGISSG